MDHCTAHRFDIRFYCRIVQRASWPSVVCMLRTIHRTDRSLEKNAYLLPGKI